MNMMRIHLLAALLSAWATVQAQPSNRAPERPKPDTAAVDDKTIAALPSNLRVTRRTRQLYQSLQALPQQGVLFGHQDDLAYGIGWKYVLGESDVKRVAGDYPAVYGWELGHLETGDPVNIDSVPFDAMRTFVRDGYRRGGVITMSWHLNKPSTGSSSWDTTAAVPHILPGGSKHALYLSWLDRVADFILSLRYKGKAIPVLFRPFHEHTGSWFWWGEKQCTPDEYKALWRLTADYLRLTRKVNNILFVYSTAEFRDEAHYLERYPGDAYVDVLGFDTYMQHTGEAESGEIYRQAIRGRLDMLTAMGARSQKPTCLAETGLEQIPVADWWTGTLWEAVKDFPITYLLLWRNGRPNHYYVPYPGHPSEADFQKFVANDRVFLESDARRANLYRTNGFWGWLFRR